MQLLNNVNSPLALLANLPQEKIARVTSVLLVVYIAYLLAELTWVFATPEQSDKTVLVTKPSQTKQASSENIDLGQLKSLHLFGEYIANKAEKKAQQVSQDLQDAPQTKLNLTLSGVVASSNKDIATAIIANGGIQNTYGIGEKIKNTRAILEQVFFDRVIIKHAGKLETLMLDGVKFNKNIPQPTSRQSIQKTTPLSSSSQLVDNRSNDKLKQRVKDIKSALNDNPGKITDYLRISPKMQNGQISGYLLMPGKDPEFFKASGLKSGDIAVQVNGYDLTSPVDAAQALQALKTESEVSLWVDRDGDVTEILFSIEN